MYEIEKYIKENGECPVDSFVKDLLNDGQKMLVTKMLHYINILEQIGFDILKINNYAKQLTDSIYELRPKSNRILFFYYSDDGKFILLHCFKKKTQKTPKNEIIKAQNEIKDYITRRKNNAK